MNVGDEPVEVVDGDGRVIEIVPRSVMRRRSLTHRSTYVVVIQHELDPSAFDHPIGGHDIGHDEPTTVDRVEFLRHCGLGAHSPLIVHRRAAWKDVNPSVWDIAFGGVCGVGETWLESARRELAEEAGLTVPLIDLGPARYTDANSDIVARRFLAVTEETPTCPDGEVVGLDAIPLDQLDQWLVRHPVCPDSVALLGSILRSIARSPESST